MEPLSWGNFDLYKGTRRFYLKSVDVKEDFWNLRTSPEKLRTLLEWDRLLCLHLVPEQPCDDLVALFYWSSLLVKNGVDPAVAEWRFLRKWLDSWGVAPSLEGCVTCGKPLRDGLWNADGLLCPQCGARGGGALLPESHRQNLLKAVQCPYGEMKKLFPPGTGGDKFWRDGSKRMKAFFDLLR